MPNQNQRVHQTAAAVLAFGLIASVLPGFAAAQDQSTADNQWGPGYQLIPKGLRIDGIKSDNPTNRVIYDNDFYFDAMDFAYLAAQAKLGRVNFRGFIVTRNSHQKDGYVRMVREYNHYRDLAIQSGLWVPEHIGGAKEPLVMPESGKIDDTKYELSDGARLIIEQADASTPENPLIVFCGGQFTTVATALLERPDIANNLIVFGAGQVENTYNSDDGWSAYVTAMRAPVVNMRERFARVDGGYDRSKKQYDPLPKNPLINAFYQTKVINEKDAGIVDGGTVVWLFNQHLVTGAQKRDLTVPPKLNNEGRLLDSFNNVNRSPYGHLHLPDGACNFGGMIEAMVDVLKDPRVWTHNMPNMPKAIEAKKDGPGAVRLRQLVSQGSGGQEYQPPAPAEAHVNAGYVPLAADKPESGGEAELFALWDEQVPWPSLEERQRPEGAVDVLVHRATEEYQFLHENAVVWHGNTLFAAWYNSPLHEIQGSASVRGRRSRDGGKTWSQVEVIAADNEGKGIFYVPVVLFSHGGTLHAYVATMVGHDKVVNCEVYVLDEATNQWESRGVIADMFQPHCTPVLMEDGNYIMAGRVSISPGTFGEWPAVAISNDTNITDPWTVIRLTEDRLRRFPEPTVWVDGKNITAISRSNPDQPPQPSSNVVGRVFTSSDYGRNWRGPILHNLPELANSKLYAGKLSSGQRYLVWTTPSGGYRNELVIAVSRPGEEQLAAVWQLQHGRSEELGVGREWSYPYAVEHDGKLYVIYTSAKKHSVMTIIPVESLELTPTDDRSPINSIPKRSCWRF